MTLRIRLLLIVGVGAVGTLAVALGGAFGFSRAHDVATHIGQVGHAQRAQMDADMMHDAIRGDVLGAALAGLRGDVVGIANAERDLAEHAARFRASLDAVDSLAQGTLTSEVAAIRPAVEAYLTSAQDAVAGARTGGADGEARQAEFQRQFSTLEARGEAFGDAVGARATAEADAAERFFARLTWAGLAFVFVTIGIGSWLGWLASRRVERAMVAIRTCVQSLANQCVESLRRGLSALADGDLTPPMVTGTSLIVMDGRDELARLAEDVNRIVTNTKAAVHDFERSRSAVRGVLKEIDGLTGAAREGNLGRRADATQHAGAFGEVVTGINDTITALVEPVQASLEALEQLAARDLTVVVSGTWRGDHARLAHACNRATVALREALVELRTDTVNTSSAAAQIAQAAEDLAGASVRQSARLDEVTAAVLQTSTQAKHVATRAAEARQVADAAKVRTQDGLLAMEQLSAAVDRIKTSSESTGRIVRTIDEIAFQTNLLALNAAVEAARAGDAGRGFAVVAEEVRSLARRAAEAAKQTSDLIAGSVSTAQEGANLAGSAVERFQEIGHGVSQVAEVVGDIAAASAEQADGVSSVTGALTDVASVTQQVAASAEESAASAQELTSASVRSRARVDQFRLDASGVALAA